MTLTLWPSLSWSTCLTPRVVNGGPPLKRKHSVRKFRFAPFAYRSSRGDTDSTLPCGNGTSRMKVIKPLRSIKPVPESLLHRAWRGFLRLHLETETKDFGWSEGFRAAIGITVPAVAGLFVNHLSLGVLGSFAVLWVLSCDLGGSYRQKANDLSAAGAVILLGYLFSGLMIGSLPRYVAGVFLWVFAGAAIGVAGSAAAQAGLVSSTIVITSVVLIVPSEFWTRFLICVFGVLWAIILSIALWPIRAHLPVFRAAGQCFVRLGSMTETFWIGAATVRRPARNLDFALAYDGLVTSLNQARQIWGMVRARRGGPTARSILLLSIIEMIDDIARTLVTLREVLNLIGEEVWFASVRGKLTRLTDSLSTTFARAASAFASRGGLVDVAVVQDTFRDLERFTAENSEFGHAYELNELLQSGRHLVSQVTELTGMIHQLGSPSPQIEPPPEARFGRKPRSYNFFAEVRSGLSLRSSSFRHALRLGIATALASLLASTVHLTRGYWIPMTVVLVLKPNFGGTLQRSVQRVTGTVLGAILASGLLISLQGWTVVLALAILAFATFAFRNRNYGLFAFALTPMVMLMLDLAHPTTVIDSALRVFYTGAGGVIALVCGYLLFPTWEKPKLPVHIAKALRAEVAFLRALATSIAGENESRPIAEYRQDAAIAVSNAATAAQRMLSEPAHLRGDVEASLAVVNYCRRILHVLAAISDYPTRGQMKVRSEELRHAMQLLTESLDDLANSLETRTEPGRMPKVSELVRGLEAIQSTAAGKAGFEEQSELWLLAHFRNLAELILSLRGAAARLLKAYLSTSDPRDSTKVAGAKALQQ